VQCLFNLTSSALQSVDGVENARIASSEAAVATMWEVHQYPESSAAIAGAARAIGTYGRVAAKSGDILEAVAVASNCQVRASLLTFSWYLLIVFSVL
jgi:hypothetical protein